MRLSSTSDSGTFLIIFPFLNIRAHPSPPAMPISASLASPGPLTAQPMTATFSGLLQEASRSSTAFAREMRSILVLPQVGQETSFTPPRFPIQRRMSLAASISLTGSSVRETRIVSPIPSHKSEPIPTADLMSPIRSVPASVTPRWSG